MSYIQDIQKQIDAKNFPKMMQLWEEFCTNDDLDVGEMEQILQAIKESDFSPYFGKYAEGFISIADIVQDPKDSYKVLRHLVDLQVTNSTELADRVFHALEDKYGKESHFKDWIRLIGLRPKRDFQGAISAFELLKHLKAGAFVFHSGGWGVGEVIEVAPFREQVVIEFENIGGQRHIPFHNAIKTLIPLPSDHFLAKRFGNPDTFEKECREDPLSAIHMLLRDLGPKNAAEIKEELCELVIPEEDWAKWWQNTRSRLKKDTLVSHPAKAKERFCLRESELKHEERFQSEIKKIKGTDAIIGYCYQFSRNHSKELKVPEIENMITTALANASEQPGTTHTHCLQIALFYEMFFPDKESPFSLSLIKEIGDYKAMIDEIAILAFRKQALIVIQNEVADWEKIYLVLLFHVQQNQLREFLLQALESSKGYEACAKKIGDLMIHPQEQPDFLVWYFQKLLADKETPKDKLYAAAEAFLTLLAAIEHKARYKELAKKMSQILIAKRYAIVRELFDEAPIDFVKEFLLLASKSHLITTDQKKNLQALAAVVHPSLASGEKSFSEEAIFWVTEKAMQEKQQRVQKIATVEVVENAREVEAARELGDLRENAEYKYAVQKRGELQRELKALSNEIKNARLLTKDDILQDAVGIGSVVAVIGPEGKKVTYTVLGSWDADPDENILSLESKFVQSMVGKKVGETFSFNNQEFKIEALDTYL